MGTRGPLKLASHLAVVPDAGTAAADVQPARPDKPECLTGELSRLWDEIVPKLDADGLLAKSDGPSIELALRHFLAARRASDELAAGDMDLWDEKNKRTMKNPAEPIFRSQSEMFLKYAAQLGMTFVSRARTPGRKGDADGDQNPFAAQVSG